jgi:hypothetical protein
MLTSPNEIVPLQIDRAATAPFSPRAGVEKRRVFAGAGRVKGAF